MPPSRRLVLASASNARLGLLTHAGFLPEVVVSGVDESLVSAPTPDELVVALAEAKAEVVSGLSEVSGAVVLGCDSLLDVDGEVHGKPSSEAEARERLLRLRGRSAVLRTGHALIDTTTGRRASASVETGVHFGDFDDEELEAYLRTGEALAVAGGFTLDGRFAPFMEGVSGDHTNVVGLSLPTFRRLLGAVDLTVMDLWP